jgi:hypothetical protein
MKLGGPVPNFYIHVSVTDLYFPTIGPHYLPRRFISGNILSNFRYSVFAVQKALLLVKNMDVQ